MIKFKPGDEVRIKPKEWFDANFKKGDMRWPGWDTPMNYYLGDYCRISRIYGYGPDAGLIPAYFLDNDDRYIWREDWLELVQKIKIDEGLFRM